MLSKYISAVSFFLICHVTFAEVQADDICTQRQCLVVVDAGSSGSRVHLYAYDQDENNNPIHIDELYTKKVTPGFSSIEVKKEKVTAYLNSIMSDVPQKNLPVYFYATAGMRLLPIQQQQDMYRLLKQWFWTQPEWNLLESRTISGGEEGLFGWLAINYQLNLLDSDKPLVSFIEIGGASTQIVFPIQNLDNIDRQDITRVSVYGRDIYLFSHSFLGLGINEVMKRHENLSTCYPLGYILPNTLIAQGDGYDCMQEISQSINKDNMIKEVTQTARDNNPSTSWYTVGAASALASKEPLAFTSGQFTAQDMLQKVDGTYCRQDWLDQKTKYNNDPYLFQNCLVAALYYSLSINGYGIQPDEIINTLPKESAEDWTLGVILHQSQPMVYN